jgi:hypothetical protein
LCDIVLREAKEIARAITEKSRIEGTMIHVRARTVHNSATTGERVEAFHVTWAPHPPYSPKISPFHFCFLVWNKTAVQGQQCQWTDDVRTSILDFWHKLETATLISVHDGRITRLEERNAGIQIFSRITGLFPNKSDIPE